MDAIFSSVYLFTAATIEINIGDVEIKVHKVKIGVAVEREYISKISYYHLI